MSILTKSNIINTFEVKGEKFVILKKDYLDELFILMKSVLEGEKLLKKGKTRTFEEFLKAISKNKKKK